MIESFAGDNNITTTTGKNIINSSSGQIRIQTTSTLSDGVFLYNGGVNGGINLTANGGLGTIQLNSTGTNTITTSGGDCEMRVTGGSGGVKLTAVVGTNPYIGIYGKNIYYDTQNTHFIRTGNSPGTVKIEVNGATTNNR